MTVLSLELDVSGKKEHIKQLTEQIARVLKNKNLFFIN
jgi:hypothetical protein